MIYGALLVRLTASISIASWNGCSFFITTLRHIVGARRIGTKLGLRVAALMVRAAQLLFSLPLFLEGREKRKEHPANHGEFA